MNLRKYSYLYLAALCSLLLVIWGFAVGSVFTQTMGFALLSILFAQVLIVNREACVEAEASMPEQETIDWWIQFSRNGSIVNMSKLLSENLGYREMGFEGVKIHKLLNFEEGSDFEGLLQVLNSQLSVTSSLLTMHGTNGQRISGIWKIKANRNDDMILAQGIDASRFESSVRSMKKNYGLMRRAFNHSPAPMIILDESRLILDLNEAALEFTKGSYENAIGKAAGDAFNCVQVQSGEICGKGSSCAECPLRKRVDETFETGVSQSNKRAVFRVATGEGALKVKWLLISTEKVHHENQDLVVLSLTDISEHYHTRSAFLEKQEKLEQIRQIHNTIIRAESEEIFLKDVVSEMNLLDAVRYCWASSFDTEGNLTEFYSPGHEETDYVLKTLYAECKDGDVPCMKDVVEDRKVQLFDSRDTIYSNWGIFKVYPGSMLAIAKVAKSKEESTFVHLLIRSEKVDRESTLMLTSLMGDIAQKLKFFAKQHELEQALKLASETITSKEDFLSVLSHELLTPLNPTIGYSELLLDRVQDDESRMYLSKILNSSRHMSFVIGDMLEFLNFKNGAIKLFVEALNVDELLRSVAETFVQHEGDVQLKLLNGYGLFEKLGPTERFLGDERLIRSIVSKLLDNAYKFTKEGFVELAYGYDCEANALCLSVKDTGIGIPKGKIDFLFDALKGVDSSNISVSEGVGLGLGLCKGFLDLVGGSISVESKEREGSTFYVKIPMERIYSPEPSVIERLQERAGALSFAGKKALVVDDSALNYKLMKAFLELQGFDVEVASDGQIALNMCNVKSYDLILTDIHMPFMTGEQLVRMIRLGYGKNAKTKIMAVTADASDQLKQRGLENGFDGWLLKPVDKGLLQRGVKEMLETK